MVTSAATAIAATRNPNVVSASCNVITSLVAPDCIAVLQVTGSRCANKLSTAATTNSPLRIAAAHCTFGRGSGRGRVIASLMNRIAGMTRGRNRNEKDRKHIGSSMSPATASTHGRPRIPTSASSPGVATSSASANDPQSPAAARSCGFVPEEWSSPATVAIAASMPTPTMTPACPRVGSGATGPSVTVAIIRLYE